MRRRDFVQGAAVAGASSSMTAGAASLAPARLEAGTGEAGATGALLPRLGPKPVVRGKKAVASSQHPIVTETMLQVMREG